MTTSFISPESVAATGLSFLDPNMPFGFQDKKAMTDAARYTEIEFTVFSQGFAFSS